jgi:type IV pilus assembly protein PilM
MTFTALLDIPLLSPEETAQAMEFQARSYIPFPLSEASTEWIPVGEYVDEKGNKKQHILVVSIPNENIEKYKHIFKLAGLNLKALETEGVSLARALTIGDPTLSLIIDIGARSTAISVAQGGLLKFCRQTDYAGASLTQALSSGLHINIKRAEMLKKKFGLSGHEGEYEMATLMLPFLDLILSEGERVRAEYEKNYHQKIERVILAGGGSNLIGIEKYASDFFKMPAVKAHAFSKVSYPQNLSPIVPQISGPFSVALGLGIKEFI